jgi:four helix bundle protein
MAGVRDFRKLAAWQRADELRILCEELLKDPRVQRDLKLRDQLSDASGSAPRNIAEGFGRYRPRENAQYVRVAKGSETEILDIFHEARSKGFISAAAFPRFETAARRAIATAAGYLRYLDSQKEPPPAKPWQPE